MKKNQHAGIIIRTIGADRAVVYKPAFGRKREKWGDKGHDMTIVLLWIGDPEDDEHDAGCELHNFIVARAKAGLPVEPYRACMVCGGLDGHHVGGCASP